MMINNSSFQERHNSKKNFEIGNYEMMIFRPGSRFFNTIFNYAEY